jgi:ferredoxin-NADP reductase
MTTSATPRRRGFTPGRPLAWQLCDVAELVEETPTVKTIVLTAPDWPGHLAGQHVDVRLTAEDGYQAERSYSIASPPEDGRLALTVERLDDGEVSPYLAEELVVGDKLELRGPIGGYFVWDASEGGPVLLVGGGSGVVPLMAMIRHRYAVGSDAPVRLLYSAKRADDVIYRAELNELAARSDGFETYFTLTREQPAGWRGYGRRVDGEMLAEVGWDPEADPHAFVCGPTGFVEAVASALVESGHPPARVKTERFGPTGG